MTDPETPPSSAEPPPPGSEAAPPATDTPAPPADTSQLAQYFLANQGSFTEEALVAAARRNGYSDDTIQAALAESRAAQSTGPTRSRAVKAIAIAYLVVYALLDVGMLLNRRPTGQFTPDAGGGILILSISLGVAFAASMVWVASRWVFGLLFFAGMALASIPGVQSFLAYPAYTSPIAFATLGIAIAGLVWLVWLRRTGRPATGGSALEVLLAVPILLLLGVGGICVASGLPIPGS